MVPFGMQGSARRQGEPSHDMSAEAPAINGGKTSSNNGVGGMTDSHVHVQTRANDDRLSRRSTDFALNSADFETHNMERKYPSVEAVLNLTSLDPSLDEYEQDEEHGIPHRDPPPAAPEVSYDPHSRSEQQLAAKLAAENPTGRMLSTPIAVAPAPPTEPYVGFVVQAVQPDDPSILTTDYEIGSIIQPADDVSTFADYGVGIDYEVGTNISQRPDPSVHTVVEQEERVEEAPRAVPVLRSSRNVTKKDISFDLKAFLGRYWKYLVAFALVLVLDLVALAVWIKRNKRS